MKNQNSPARSKKLSPEFLQKLACPLCTAGLIEQEGRLHCRGCGEHYSIIDGIPDLLPKDLPKDIVFSEQKWSQKYREASHNIAKIVDEDRFYLRDSLTLFANLWPRMQNKVYLELGCGSFPLGIELAKKGAIAIGIDFSLPALQIAQRLAQKNKVRVFLVRGDIRHLPLRSNQIDYAYGAGVIEHFKNYTGAVGEMGRVMKPGGKLVNTVPYVSLGTLTYRQLWGNIPNIPVIKQLAELIHIRLLGGRHMIFGYELSFTAGQMRRMFQRAGFAVLSLGPLPHKIMLERIRFPGLRKILQRLARMRLFWPMILLHAQKLSRDAIKQA